MLQPSVQTEALKAIGRLYSLAYPEMYVDSLARQRLLTES